MKKSETSTPAPPYLGHVKTGVIILDVEVSLQDGQTVRVEPLDEATGTPVDAERDERVRRMREFFAQWTDEDAKLSDADADVLHAALAEHRGLQFRSPSLD
jgi:hypothetical protein